MKITTGRKFLGCIVATVIIITMFILALLIAPASITSSVLIFFGSLTVTIWFAYIGGNVWSKWVKSKHFQPDLLKNGGN